MTMIYYLTSLLRGLLIYDKLFSVMQSYVVVNCVTMASLAF